MHERAIAPYAEYAETSSATANAGLVSPREFTRRFGLVLPRDPGIYVDLPTARASAAGQPPGHGPFGSVQPRLPAGGYHLRGLHGAGMARKMARAI